MPKNSIDTELNKSLDRLSNSLSQRVISLAALGNVFGHMAQTAAQLRQTYAGITKTAERILADLDRMEGTLRRWTVISGA